GRVYGVTLATSPQFLSGSYFFAYDGLTLTNGATLDMSGGTSGVANQFGDVTFQGVNSQTLAGSGVGRLSTNVANSHLYNNGSAGVSLTIGPGILVHGVGHVQDNGLNDGGIINQGTIIADVPGQVLYFDGYSVTNGAGGNLIATNGAILQIGSGATAWHNAG